MAAIALTGAFCSCSSDDDMSENKGNALIQNVEAFGTHSSTVDVSIGSKKGFVTRGCDTNSNMWGGIPDYPTEAERAGVMAYIGSQVNPESVAWPGWTFYFVQHVDGAHHKYEYKDWNGAWHRDIDGTASMEHMQILENSGNWQHVNNFNAGKGNNEASHNCSLMTDGFKDAKTLNEYSSSTIKAWCLFKWNGNYYLGFDFDAKKGDGEIPGDGIYDDWVVKIIPCSGEKKPIDPTDDPKDNPKDDPTDDPITGIVPEVEVDIHHQAHKDWNEIKTSIHLRDTANVRVFIPVEKELQAMPDDFDIRTGEDYTYIEKEVKEVVVVKYTIASKEFEIEVQVNHKADGIEILVGGANCAEALRYARGIYNDGITFEIHSYLIPTLSPATIWEDILKKVEIPETSLAKWPGSGSCITHTYGQMHSAYYENELIPFVKDPE